MARLQERDIRRVLASGLVALGVLCALSAGVFRYVDQHFHSPEAFLDNTSSLANNADLRDHLFDGFRTEIISLADGTANSEVEEEPATGFNLDFDDDEEDVNDPVNAERIERDQAIELILLAAFESDLYKDTFAASLASMQTQIARTASLEPEARLRDAGELTFSLRGLYPTIYEELAKDERTAEITQNVVPDQFGIFPVGDRETTIDMAWTAVDNGPSWRSLTTALAIISLIGAVVIAERRPSRAVQFGLGIVGVAVVVVVLVYLIRFIVPLLAGGGASAGPVVAVYAANMSPLVGVMLRLIGLGLALALVGAIARLIWPDDWVYSSVSDDRGVRSIMRRRGAPQVEPAQVPVAAAVPVGQPGYYGQPYGAYPQPQWGQPYPPQQYPPGYAPYPVGPYAQPGQPVPQHYTSPGQPTVPVMPVHVEAGATVAEPLVPPPVPPLEEVSDALPADAAQAVPRVVATTNHTLEASTNGAVSEDSAGQPTESVAQVEPVSSQEPTNDGWSTETDW